jgi:EpsI family protein
MKRSRHKMSAKANEKKDSHIAPAKRAFPARSALIAVGLVLAAGGVGHRWLDHLLLAAESVPVQLRAPLSSLPMKLGDWQGAEVPMDQRVMEVAGNDDQVSRQYTDSSGRESVNVYVAYAARPAKMLSHRPGVCYPAHGWTPRETQTQQSDGGGGEGFNYLLSRFARNDPVPEEILVLNYYVLRGRYITDWTEFWGPSWRLPNLSRDPSFYVVQVQLSTMIKAGVDVEGAAQTLTQMLPLVDSHLRKLLPEVPAILQ